MLRTQKSDFVEAMKADLAKAEVVLFVDFTGMTVAEADALRKRLRDSEVKYQVVKNTLMARALADTPFANAAECLKGTPTGVAIGFEDPVAPARVTFEFLKTCQHAKVKGGVLDNKSISSAEAEALSKMPGRREMQGQVLALALGPATRLLQQIKGPAGRIVGALEKKAEE